MISKNIKKFQANGNQSDLPNEDFTFATKFEADS